MPLVAALVVAALVEPPLRWEAPSACPALAQVEADAAAFLGRALPADTDVRAHATIVTADAGFELALELEGVSGRETFAVTDGDCRVLGEVVALKLALAIDAADVVEVVTPAPTIAAAPVAAPVAASPAPVAAAPVAPAPAVDRGPRIAAIILPAFGVRWGVAPSFGPVVALGVGLGGAYWRAWVQGASDLPRTTTTSDPRGRSVELAVATGAVGLRACVVAPAARLEVSACGGIDGGVMRGRARGVEAARTSLQPWVAASIGPGVDVHVHPALSITARVGLLANVVRPGFRLASGPELYRTPGAAAEMTMGLAFRWPPRRSASSR